GDALEPHLIEQPDGPCPGRVVAVTTGALFAPERGRGIATAASTTGRRRGASRSASLLRLRGWCRGCGCLSTWGGGHHRDEERTEEECRGSGSLAWSHNVIYDLIPTTHQPARRGCTREYADATRGPAMEFDVE